LSQINKLYRNFIILQEDERGFSTTNDKTLSGYSKIEARGEKCKISFYAQNLRSDSDDYHVLVIFNKKDTKKLIDLGTIAISEGGKAEITKEYFRDDIGGLGLSYDKISGAAIVKMRGSIPIVVMCGFINGEQPTEEWKNFTMENDSLKKTIDKSEYVRKEDKRKKDRRYDEHREINELESSLKEETLESSFNTNSLESSFNQDSFDIPFKEGTLENPLNQNTLENSFNQDSFDIPFKEDTLESPLNQNTFDRDNLENPFSGNTLENPFKIKEEIRAGKTNSKFDSYEMEVEKAKEFVVRGSVGEYFESIASGFEVINESYRDIKYCKWYNVPVNDLNDMCNMSNYNRYTVAYYPMLNYYPYIRKYGSFKIGYKCDREGNLKYIVYGIPGKDSLDEQPYEGKTGFVTWVKDENRGALGCWLMFYDFRNSTVVVPME